MALFVLIAFSAWIYAHSDFSCSLELKNAHLCPDGWVYIYVFIRMHFCSFIRKVRFRLFGSMRAKWKNAEICLIWIYLEKTLKKQNSPKLVCIYINMNKYIYI